METTHMPQRDPRFATERDDEPDEDSLQREGDTANDDALLALEIAFSEHELRALKAKQAGDLDTFKRENDRALALIAKWHKLRGDDEEHDDER
jgi:hypothetical protein